MMNFDNFALLYNTLGYEKNGTKKAYIRSVDPVDENSIGKIVWTLKKEKGDAAASGKMTYRGFSFGVQLWDMFFSEVTTEGEYTLEANIFDKEGNLFDKDVSQPFRIEKNIYSNNLLTPITVYNAQARTSTEEHGFGYYDCHSCMGEARSHGDFLYGLSMAYAMAKEKFTPENYEGLREAANIAFDYLVTLHDDATGEFLPAYHTRPNLMGNYWMFNSYEALYGFSAYLHIFKDLEPDRATEENYRRAEQSVEYVLANMPKELSVSLGHQELEFMAAVYYHLYKYSGDEKWKERGVELVGRTLENLNLREVNRECRHATTMLEGAYLFMKEFPDHPDYKKWMTQLRRIKAEYYEVLPAKNAFSIQPVSDRFSTVERNIREWDDMAPLPMDSAQYITRRAANAIDACFLGELTGDPTMEAIATAELGYAMGLNTGFEQRYVENPPTERKMAACAILANFNKRRSSEWNWCEYTMKNNTWMSFMNGFLIEDRRYRYEYDEEKHPYSWRFSEIFIKHDGAFAYAFCVYERYLKQLEESC